MLDRAEKIPSYRFTAVQYALVALFLVLAYGLWRLQVSGGERYEQLAQRNRVRGIPVMAPRGKILDREGRILVDNYPSFTVLYQREQGAPSADEMARMATGLHMSVEDIQERLRRRAGEPAFRPAVIKDDITPDELAFVEAHRPELQQLDVIMVHRRLYPRNGFAAHLIGYVGEVSERMLDQPGFELYEAGDIVGQYGVEQTYNHLLMGKDGYRRVVVDSRGREVGQLEQTAATPGKQLRLTVDLDLQIAAEEALEGNVGAIVALDPRNGEVLAMASRPTFDPNAFTVGISREEWSRLVNDPDKPMLNKATQAQLAPGSVFKILMSVAGLEEGVAQTMNITCPGGRNFYGRFFKCHRVHGGGVEIRRAITESCDTFFYTLAERLGIDRIARYATRLGLGQKTNIDLPQEAAGVMPSEEWKVRNFRQKWYAGETISVGIGQGAVATTPIQLARAIGGIATDGVLYRPHVAFPEEMQGPAHAAAAEEAPDRVLVPMDLRNWEIITDGMAGVVNPGGTAASAHLEGIDFAGKTGSSQVVSNQARRKLTGARYRDNGWFVGLAPRRNPEIVVAVLVEGGEHGYVAARLAAQVIKAHFDKKQRKGVKVAQWQAPAPRPGLDFAGVWSPSRAGATSTEHAERFALSFESRQLPSRFEPAGKPEPETIRQFRNAAIPHSP